MAKFESIIKGFDRASADKANQIVAIILGELHKRYGLIDTTGMSPTQFLQVLLMDPQYDYLKDALFDLLEYYEVNDRNIIFRMLNLVNQYNIPDDVRATFAQSFKALPFVLKFDGKQVISMYGVMNTIPLYKFRNVGKMELSKVFEFRGHCHEIAQIFADCLSDDYIVTSKIPNLFGGSFLHSYYELRDSDNSSNIKGTLDLTGGTFYEGTSFKTMYEPEEIIKYSARELESRYEELLLREEDVPRQWCPVLALAIDEVKKGK